MIFIYHFGDHFLQQLWCSRLHQLQFLPFEIRKWYHVILFTCEISIRCIWKEKNKNQIESNLLCFPSPFFFLVTYYCKHPSSKVIIDFQMKTFLLSTSSCTCNLKFLFIKNEIFSCHSLTVLSKLVLFWARNRIWKDSWLQSNIEQWHFSHEAQYRVSGLCFMKIRSCWISVKRSTADCSQTK